MVLGTGAVSNIKFFTGQFSRQFLPNHNNSAQTCYTLVSFEYQLFDSRKTKNGNINQCVIYIIRYTMGTNLPKTLDQLMFCKYTLNVLKFTRCSQIH